MSKPQYRLTKTKMKIQHDLTRWKVQAAEFKSGKVVAYELLMQNPEISAHITYLLEHCKESPHECSVPNCPGNRNRLRLELFDRYKRELEGLTPGGSEFVDEPERCAKHASDRLESLRSDMSMWARRAKTNEAKAALFDEMLAALGGLR